MRQGENSNTAGGYNANVRQPWKPVNVSHLNLDVIARHQVSYNSAYQHATNLNSSSTMEPLPTNYASRFAAS